MRKGQVRVITLFVGIVALSTIVGWMWVRGWESGTMLHDAVWDAAELFDVGVGRPIEVMMSVLLGAYLTALAMVTVDWRKRVQGTLLVLGSFVVLAVLWQNGMLLVHLDPALENGIGFLVGAVVIGLLERDELGTILDDRTLGDREFDRALTSLFLAIAVVVVAAWIQVFLVGELLVLVDTPATFLLLYLMVGFFTFTSNATTAVVGPRESGKTTSILGLYHAFNDRRENVTEPTTALDNLLSQVDDMSPGDDWPIENTTGFEEIGFYHVIGGLFPRRYRISAWDHPGETLDRLANHLEDDLSFTQRLRSFLLDIQTLVLPGYSRTLAERFYNETRNADLAILLIDIQRLLDVQRSTEIHKLRKVGLRVRQNGGEVLVAATKVDLILDDLVAGTDADPQELAEEAAVKNILNEELQARSQIADMLKDVGCDEIHPLFFKHTENADGMAVPTLDEYGDLQAEGHDQFAAAIERVLRNV